MTADEMYNPAYDVAVGYLTEEEALKEIPEDQVELFREVVGHIEDELRWAHDEAVLEEAALHE